jgi:hypothetical protein
MSAEANDDAWAAELEVRAKSLEQRQQELDAERAKWGELAREYAKFLRDRGKPAPAFVAYLDETKPPTPVRADRFTRVFSVTPRISDRRKVILRCIAKINRQENRAATSPEILEITQLEKTFVANILWQDFKRKYLSHEDAIEGTAPGKFHQYKLTELGWELLKRAGLDENL